MDLAALFMNEGETVTGFDSDAPEAVTEGATERVMIELFICTARFSLLGKSVTTDGDAFQAVLPIRYPPRTLSGDSFPLGLRKISPAEGPAT